MTDSYNYLLKLAPWDIDLPILIERINSRYGNVVSFGVKPIQFAPFGLPALDDKLGGGYPKGKIVHIYGEECSGKTRLSLMACAAAYSRGGTACFIDASRSLSYNYASALGCPDNMPVLYPDTLEQMFNMVRYLLYPGSLDLIVIDTLLSLPSKQMPKNIVSYSNENTGALISSFLSVISPMLYKTGTTLICLCDMSIDPYKLYGNPLHPQGGYAIRHYSALTLYCNRRYEDFTDNVGSTPDYIHSGVKSLIKVEKNKYGRSQFTVPFFER
ncbi:MAG: hypothetical protein ACI38A_05890 [Candidatus Ornithomonoglobus sp.]